MKTKPIACPKYPLYRKIDLYLFSEIYPIGRWVIVFMLFNILVSCTSPPDKEVNGLWQLEELNVDALTKSFGPLFLQIRENKSFAVSRRSGDLSGTYGLNADQLKMYSSDKQWFNTNWKVINYRDYMILKGTEIGYRHTWLKFRKIKRIPDFQNFQNSMIGRWQLYKMKNKAAVTKLSHTWFDMDLEGNYSIVDLSGIVESGKAVVNTRHKKIFFTGYDTPWHAWYYGQELRLTNRQMNVQYSLRRIASK